MKTRVLIIDDSAVMRKMLSEVIGNMKNFEIAGTAMDPYIAATKINKLKPDLLTLDIEMPRMDGLTFLSKLMIAGPLPVIMISAFTESGARETLKALQLGAMDFILKPRLNDEKAWDAFREELTEKISSLNLDKIRSQLNSRRNRIIPLEVEEKYSADVIITKKDPKPVGEKTESVIAIGASTGGTEVIAEIMSRLPESTPGIIIAQHMPEKFTEAFARRVDGISRLHVAEAKPGNRLYRGMALVAPGNKHMILHRDSHGYWVEINEGQPVNRHRPSVDVLFRSAAQAAGHKALGIILTGMGADGAAGLREMKDAGAFTIAQDEDSCVVFGMPQAAIKLEAVARIMNINEIAGHINKMNCKI